MTEEIAILSRQQWAVCAGFISAATGRIMPEETLEAYYAMLNDIPCEALQIACRRAIQSEETTWLPAVGLLRKFAAEAMYGVLLPAREAWEQLKDAYAGDWWGDNRDAINATLPEFVVRVYQATGETWDEEKYIKTYDKMAKQEMELRKISPALRPAINGNSVATPRLSDQSRSRLIGMGDN